MYSIRHIDDSFDDNPNTEVLSDLYDELAKADAEHGDVSVIHEDTGWCISAHRDGRLVMVHLEEGGARHMIPVPKARALTLWSRLIEGDIGGLLDEPWRTGYIDQ
jgi:hypothetical protein